MADTKYVVSNVLCYLANKYGMCDSKSLRDIVSDFYDSEELSRAKTQLTEDIQSVVSSSLSVPHIPTRRDGDNKAVRIVDDILTLITFADENLVMSALPSYVADNPDRLPSARLYEGDMALLVGLVKKLEGRVDQVDVQLAAIVRAVHDVGIQVCKPSSLQAWPALSVSAAAVQVERSRVTADSLAVGSGPSTSTSAAAYIGVRSADRSAEQTSSAAGIRTDWASMASASPVNVSNRYAALQTTDDEHADGSQYEVSRSARRRAKRQRQHSQQSHQAQQRQQQCTSVSSEQHQDQRQDQRHEHNQNRGQDRGPGQGQGRAGNSGLTRVLVGMAPSVSSHGLVAAKKIVRKAVFCIGNLASNCVADDVRRHAEALSVRVFTCFPVVSRSRRRDDDDDEEQATSDRHAFRLCIAAEDRERLLDANRWPESVLIRPWFRIPPAVTAERRVAGVSSASSQRASSAIDNSETIPKALTTASTTSTANLEGTSSMDNADMDCTILYHHGDDTEGAAI